MEKKNGLVNGAMKMLAKVTKNEAEKNMRGWPPHCMGIYHQPKRPKTEVKNNK